MNDTSIISIKHFAAYNQIIEDYKSLLVYEQELLRYDGVKRKTSSGRIKNEIIFLLHRIIENKNILKENSEADQNYISKLVNEES